MDERLKNWHPTQEEVRSILQELRPLIGEFARRDREVMRQCVISRSKARTTARRRRPAAA